jgi:hypothetical protein
MSPVQSPVIAAADCRSLAELAIESLYGPPPASSQDLLAGGLTAPPDYRYS